MIRRLVFVSVPMNGKTNEEIERSLQKARTFYMTINDSNAKDVAFIDDFDFGKKDERYEECMNPRIGYLGRAIKRLALCSEAVFGPGWEKADGCYIEHEICKRYKIPMVIMKETKSELEKSIELARECGVPEEKILHNQKEIDDFFMTR